MKKTIIALGLLTAPSALAAQGYGSQPPAQTPTAPKIDTAKPAKAEKEAAAQRKINISRGAQKAVVELQTAVSANDTANIPAKLQAARAVAKTDEDSYYISILELRAGIAAKDNNMIASALEALVASNQTPAADLQSNYVNLGKVYSSLKQPDKAAAALERAVQLNPSDTEALVMLGELQNSRGQTAAGITMIRQAIAAKRAAGQPVDEQWYKRVLTLAYNAKMPVATDIAREWVQAFPSEANWRDAISIYRNLSKPEEVVLLDLFRLSRATGALNGDVDYSSYVYVVADQRNAREGKQLLDEAAAAGKIDLSKPVFVELQKGLKTRPMPGEDILAESAKAQLAGTDGAALALTANRYYGIGNYAKAAELFRAALGKPGVDQNQVNLQLGIALAAAGDKAGAKAAFDAVGGNRTEVAKYWLAYLATKA